MINVDDSLDYVGSIEHSMNDTERLRARTLYVNSVTRDQRDALSRAEELRAKRGRPSKMHDRMVTSAANALAAAQLQCVEVFEAVLRGEIDP